MNRQDIDVTRRLGSFVADCPSSAIPERAIIETKRALIDLFAAMLAGIDTDTSRIVREYVATESASGSSAVLGSTRRSAPSLAALANGTTGHALDLDDIGLQVGHPTVAIAPAAIAVAEAVGASGADFLCAMVLGYEVAARLTSMYDDNLGGPYARGYHGTSIYGVFGATAAAGRLLGLDERAIQNAFGIAASEAAGLRVNFGSMTKPFHAGMANRSGVEAALLARSGFTADAAAIEGRYGWFQVLCASEGDLSNAVAGLGGSFAIEQGLIFKRYPSCGANHYAISGVRRLLTENDLAWQDVCELEVTIHSRYFDEVLLCDWPTRGLEGKFSLAYNVAGALVDGDVTLATFADDQVERLSAVRDRIRVAGRTDMPRRGAYVNAVSSDGRQLSLEQWTLRGSYEDPMTTGELEDKLRASAAIAGLAPDDVAGIIAFIDGLEHEASLVPLTTLLAVQH